MDNQEKTTFKDKYNDPSVSWQNKAMLISLYHSIMKYQYPTWTQLDTAQHFEVSVGLVSENIRLSREMDDGKNARKIKNSKTREEGLRYIDRRYYTEDRKTFNIIDEDEL